MESLVPIVLIGWLPLVLIIFRDLRGHRGAVAAFVIGWLFLPSLTIPLSGLPDFSKVWAVSLGAILATVLFETKRLLQFRPRWFDLPILLYSLSPIPSAYANGLGTWHGISESLELMMGWAIPYFIGRLYFTSFEAIRSLCQGIVLGGIVYIPFCLFEMRMSPQLHNLVYGSTPNRFNAARFGGWRPQVFLSQGLELGMWMTAASLIGVWLWYSGALKKIWGVRVSAVLPLLLVTTVLCRATGALCLLVGGLAAMLVSRIIRVPAPILAILLVPPLYIGVRVSGMYDGQHLVAMADQVFGAERAQSLQFRFDNEVMLIERALQSPWFGWGGYGREMVVNEFGERVSTVDGMWILTLGLYGMVGLTGWYLAFLITPTLATVRFSARYWAFSDAAPVISLCVLTALYSVDCLLNGMNNSVYPLALGAISTVCFLPACQLLRGSIPPSRSHVDWNEDVVDEPRPERRLWPPHRSGTAVEPAAPAK